MPPLFVVGDVHGHRDVLVGLLREAGLVDSAERWVAADAAVWLLGDLVDRAPDGIGTIDLVRRLEDESDGRVRCLLGNHEAFLLSVHLVGVTSVDEFIALAPGTGTGIFDSPGLEEILPWRHVGIVRDVYIRDK